MAMPTRLKSAALAFRACRYPIYAFTLLVYFCAGLLRSGLHVRQRRTIERFGFRLLERLDVLGRQLGTIDPDCQLVEFGRQRERRLVVRVIHAGERVGADIQALVPLQDHGQRTLHLDGLNGLAVHLERAGAGTAEAA
jgi:hypothetical protein